MMIYTILINIESLRMMNWKSCWQPLDIVIPSCCRHCRIHQQTKENPVRQLEIILKWKRQKKATVFASLDNFYNTVVRLPFDEHTRDVVTVGFSLLREPLLLNKLENLLKLKKGGFGQCNAYQFVEEHLYRINLTLRPFSILFFSCHRCCCCSVLLLSVDSVSKMYE